MLIWFAETTLIATVLAGAATLAGRCFRLGPVARHAFWLVVLVKLVTPPIVSWPRPLVVHAAAKTAPVAFTHDISKAQPSLAQMVRDRVIQTLRDRNATAAKPAVPSIWPSQATIGRVLIATWAVASVGLGLVQMLRIVRFRRRLRFAVPAPSWLEKEVDLVGERLGVKVPEVLVVPAAITPLLWCLGRPKLLLPEKLVKTLSADGWRGILAHELAHLQRRDHWVRRIELLAGLVWWWNPVFWLTRGRLDAEAELACDECAVRTFPEGQLAYAEALLEVCRSISPPKPPVPALGIVGAGQFRFLERRVSMILRDPSPSRPKTPVLLSAGLLAMLALPAWSSSVTPASLAPSKLASAASSGAVALNVDDDDDASASDDEKTAKKKAKKDREEARARKLEKRKKQVAEEAKEVQVEVDIKADLDSKVKQASELAAKLSEKLGPGSAFEKAMTEKLGPGSEFEKTMEKLGPQLESAMKGIAGELEAALGPDSDFAKEMKEAFGPDSEFAKGLMDAFGPESEFAKELKDAFGPDCEFAREMKEAFGPDGELAREMKAASDEMKAAKIEAANAAMEAMEDAKVDKATKNEGKKKEAKADEKSAKARARAEIKAQIEALSKKLEELEGDEDDDN